MVSTSIPQRVPDHEDSDTQLQQRSRDGVQLQERSEGSQQKSESCVGDEFGAQEQQDRSGRACTGLLPIDCGMACCGPAPSRGSVRRLPTSNVGLKPMGYGAR